MTDANPTDATASVAAPSEGTAADAAGRDAAATDALYQRAILDYARTADGSGRLAAPSAAVRIDNPLCGDQVTVEVALAGDTVTALAHRVRGCVLCQTAAAVLGRHAPGHGRAELRRTAAALAAMLREGAAVPAGWPDLAMFLPVRSAKARHDCVLLPFQALEQALRTAPSDVAGSVGGAERATAAEPPRA